MNDILLFWGPHSFLFNKYGSYLPHIKQSGIEDHSPHSVEVKNEWCYTPTPPVFIPSWRGQEQSCLLCCTIWL
jgi:hypothetical protein